MLLLLLTIQLMNLTRTSYIRLLRIILASVLVIIIAAYAIWRSLNYARGPAIAISSPVNGSSVDTETVEILGRADRVNNLIMNGQPISIDEKGNFDQTVVVFYGTNKITFSASDQFGRNIKKELDIVGTKYLKDLPPNTSSSNASSTTSSTTTAI